MQDPTSQSVAYERRSAIEHVLSRLRTPGKLGTHDIKRTDLRFRAVLSELPKEYLSLNEAIEGLRAAGDESRTPVLQRVLDEVDRRMTAISRLSLEQELLDAIRPVLASDRDAACLELLMGWVDGQLTTPEDVAAEFDTRLEHVLEIEAHAKAVVARRGLMCPKLLHTLDKAVKSSPVHDKWVTRTLHERRYSKLPWGVRTLIASADLLSIDTGLNIMEIGDIEYLTLLSDESYPQRVIDRATDLAVINGRVTIAEIAEHVSAEIGQPMKRGDVRIVVAKLPGVVWLDHTRDSFEFSA